MKKKQIFVYILVSLLFYSKQSIAAEWSNTNLIYLSGKGYRNAASKDKKDDYDILTIEHASGWKYGDNYFFTDISKIDSDSPSQYTEISPRLSSHKIFKANYGEVIKDILLASQLNVASGAPRIYLYGLGLDVNVPLFDFLKIHLYERDNRNIPGRTLQGTIAWKMSFTINQKFVFGGFIDYAGSEGSGAKKAEANILAQPSIAWMVKDNIGLGIEYQYWQNKFGIKNLNESLPQLMIKWTL